MVNSEVRKKTFELITQCVEELLLDLDKGVFKDSKVNDLAQQLINDYEGLNEILNTPHGGALAPEEIAEAIVFRFLKGSSVMHNNFEAIAAY